MPVHDLVQHQPKRVDVDSRVVHDLWEDAEGRGSAVEGRGSAVEGRGSAVEGRGSTVEGRGSALGGTSAIRAATGGAGEYSSQHVCAQDGVCARGRARLTLSCSSGTQSNQQPTISNQRQSARLTLSCSSGTQRNQQPAISNQRQSARLTSSCSSGTMSPCEVARRLVISGGR